MGVGTVPGFSWRDLPHIAGRVENPLLRQPLSLVVDDPNPGYNPAHFHLGFRYGPPLVPRELVDQFADVVEAHGIRGKFSVIPNPFGLGRIDQSVQGLSDADVAYFLDAVRTRIAPALDITPEVLTHWNALDPRTGLLLPYWEHVWSRQQTGRTLLPYLSLALEILNNVDLPCSGMTSPWDFGAGVEDEYAGALLEAQRRVNGRTLTWYFLHMDNTASHVPPRPRIFQPAAGAAVVSIIACDGQDFGRAVWTYGAPQPDELISADGQRGRLAQVLAAGGPAVFHTHWQTLFSHGSGTGLAALNEVARRIGDHFGDRVVWTRCSDLAAYAAAAAGVEVTSAVDDTGSATLEVTTPFTCACFTLSLEGATAPRMVTLDNVPLQRAAEGAVREGSYMISNGRLYLCWSPRAGQRLTIHPG